MVDVAVDEVVNVVADVVVAVVVAVVAAVVVAVVEDVVVFDEIDFCSFFPFIFPSSFFSPSFLPHFFLFSQIFLVKVVMATAPAQWSRIEGRSGTEWNTWQLFSSHCQRHFGIPPDGHITNSTAFNCLARCYVDGLRWWCFVGGWMG